MNAADRSNPSLRIVTLPFATSKSSCRRAMMLSRWLAADARLERTGARPKQRRRGKTAPTFVSNFTVVRFLDGVDRGDRISLVTMAARCFFHHRARKNRRRWPATELLPQFSQARSGALERDSADRLSPGRSGKAPVAIPERAVEIAAIGTRGHPFRLA